MRKTHETTLHKAALHKLLWGGGDTSLPQLIPDTGTAAGEAPESNMQQITDSGAFCSVCWQLPLSLRISAAQRDLPTTWFSTLHSEGGAF